MTPNPSPVPRGPGGRRTVASLAAAALVATGLSLGAAPAAHAATETLVIDFATSTGPFKGGASGMLYGLGDDGVPTDAIIAGAGPHHLTQKAPNGAQHPNGDPLEVERSLFENGGRYMMTNIQDYYPDWPYLGGQRPADFETYLDIIRTVVADVRDNSAYPERYIFTPFNEPDSINWYGSTQLLNTFLTDWKVAYETIKEVYPEAKIAGPGDSRWQPVRTRAFLTFAKANDVMPDMFTWHELGRNNLSTYRSNYNAYRALELELGIDPLPVNINEYAMRRDMSVPGNIVQWLSMFEDTKVDAQTAYWTYAGNLNDNMAKNNSANGAWWLLKWYADLSGETVQLTPPVLNRPDTLQGIAALDEDKRQATVLFGGTNNEVRLDMSGLDPEVFGATVDIQVREAEWSGQEGEAQAPPVIKTERAELGSGTLSLDVPNDDRLSAYQVVITPALPTQPEVDSTWRAVVEAEDTVLRDVQAYNQSPTDDWTFAASRGRDVGSTNRVTSALTWTVTVPTDGTYRFGAVAGVNGPSIGPGQHALFVDGTHAATIDYEAGFSWGYRGRGETEIELTAGTHELSVRMSANGTTLLPGSDISLDKFDLTRVDGPDTTTYPAVLARIGDATIDYTAGDGGVVEISGDESVTFFPSVRETGYHDLTVEYAAEGEASLGLAVNRRDLEGLGADAAGTWTSTARVHLAKGISEVVVTAPEGAQVSSLTVTRAAESDDATVTIEAEDASQVTLHGDARLENVAQPTNVSGQQLAFLGGNEGSYAVVARPDEIGAGQYNLSVRYANAERNTGHDYNTDVITRFLDISEDGGATTRGAFRHNYSWKGFWTHTVPVDLTTGDGDLRLGNATGNAPNIDWFQLSPLSLGVTNTGSGSDDLVVELEATARCVAGRAHVVVRAANANAVAVDVDVESGYGSRSFASVGAERAVSAAFATRASSIPAGTVTASVTGEVDGSQVTTSVEGTHPALSCG